jgi:hypothetical protein
MPESQEERQRAEGQVKKAATFLSITVMKAVGEKVTYTVNQQFVADLIVQAIEEGHAQYFAVRPITAVGCLMCICLLTEQGKCDSQSYSSSCKGEWL